jgi:endonuclease/exonuclease/phosphatase family metal-dependent hydrolase
MSSEGIRIRVLSWNVHGCVDLSGRFDPQGVLDVILRLSPDIVALQELDSRRRLTGDFDTFDYLKTSLGWPGAEARTIRDSDGDYGHALMARWDLEQVENLDLSVRRREPRMAISSTVRTPGGRVHVVATHLGLSARERREQIRKIAGHVNTNGAGPAIVLGDFNEWRRRGVATRSLCPPFEIAAGLPSFPSRRPILPLDRIWCRPPLEPRKAHVDTTASHQSDHLPVIAELKLHR